MKTDKQQLGERGEGIVRASFDCFKCKKPNTLKKLINNFKCADIICDFCGYLAQVKTKRVTNIDVFPDKILGAAWQPQKERMDAGIYFPLFLVLIHKINTKRYSVFYIPSDLQSRDMFIKRNPLSQNAKRAGWQGFYYEGNIMKDLATKLI